MLNNQMLLGVVHKGCYSLRVKDFLTTALKAYD